MTSINDKFWISKGGILLLTIILTVNGEYGENKPLVSVKNQKNNSIPSNKTCNEVCSTPTCLQEASFYLGNMDQKIDPCVDFYQFVCGNFSKNAIIPEDISEYNMFYIAYIELQKELLDEIGADIKPNDLKSVKNLKTHYQNCLNISFIEQENTEPFFKIIEELGGWPVLLGNKWTEDSYDWKETVSKISKLGFEPTFPFIVFIDQDSKDSTKNIIQLQSAKTQVSDTYFLNDNKSLIAYQHFMTNITVLLGASEDTALKEMKECLDFEVKLHQIKTKPYILLEVSPTENQKSIKDLAKNYRNVAWLDILNKILNPSNVLLSETEIIEIEDPNYISKLGDLIEETPKRVLANYQIWQIINLLVHYMPKRFDEKKLDLDKITEGLKNRPKRETQCMDKLLDILPVAVSAVFVKKYFNKQIKENVNELVQNIKTQTAHNIGKINWMDAQTRNAALEKLNDMGALVAFPDELLDDEKVEKYFKNLDIYPGSYFGGFMNITAFTKTATYQRLKRPAKEGDWIIKANVAQINAFYYQRKNQIVVTAGILQERFFQIDRPTYLNYGAIGIAIAHEITHGFDSFGRKYDRHGNYRNWWQSDTEKEFERKSKCLINQYSKYTISQIGVKMNGNQTLTENISDNGGTKLAYYAYRDWAERKNIVETCLPGLSYTPQQMFWISAASNFCAKSKDEYLQQLVQEGFHSPSEARVNVPLSNINEFANDFNCNLCTKMNPKHKCTVW